MRYKLGNNKELLEKCIHEGVLSDFLRKNRGEAIEQKAAIAISSFFYYNRTSDSAPVQAL